MKVAFSNIFFSTKGRHFTVKRSKWIYLVLMLLPLYGIGQKVETLVDTSLYNMNHGCAIGSDRFIYSTDLLGSGLFNGQTIYRTQADGTTEIFARGINGATNMAWNAKGELFVSELNLGRILKIKEDGSKSIFATGLAAPAGIAFDSQGNMYIANFQAALVMKITPQGIKSVFANTPIEPTGIIIDEDNNLYVSHETPHVISKISPSGEVTEFVNIPNTKFQYLTWLGEDILVAGSTNHKIYRVKADGNYSVFAGSGEQGKKNGQVLEASFDNPTGIAVTASQDTVYIVEKGRIRRITNVLSTSANLSSPSSFRVFPTLFENWLGFENLSKGTLEIYHFSGQRMIQTPIEQQSTLFSISTVHLPKGIYSYIFYDEDGLIKVRGKLFKY